MRFEAALAAASGSVPVSTWVMYALIGLSPSTAAQRGELGVARPCAAPSAIAAEPSSPLTASARVVGSSSSSLPLPSGL